ncbi:MAG TPA: NAD-dependent epimerase/dehydratase family protein [Microbacteriaceae bacterium]|nr:NAD-dependent epimerase/dehydratase family protein [Microbacteriaceae bacterium]
MTTYLVTGGAGFIGHHLVDRLLGDGHRVVVVDNERSGRWDRVAAAAERDTRGIEAFSLSDWMERLKGVDVVFHLAAEKYNSSHATPERVLDVNVVATERLFRAAAVSVDKLVFTSSLYAYGAVGPEVMRETDLPAPRTHYGASKLMGEHLLRAIDRDTPFAWTVARLFFIYGPNQYAEGGYKSVIMTNFERLAAGLAPTIKGDGEQALDYVYIDDCIDALIELAGHRHDGGTFNVATGEGPTINQLTDTMMEVVGYLGSPVALPPDWTAGTFRVGDPALLTKAGWRPRVGLEDGLDRVWSWMRNG